MCEVFPTAVMGNLREQEQNESVHGAVKKACAVMEKEVDEVLDTDSG